MSKESPKFKNELTHVTGKTNETTFEGFEGKAPGHIPTETNEDDNRIIAIQEVLDFLGTVSGDEIQFLYDEGIMRPQPTSATNNIFRSSDKIRKWLDTWKVLILEIRKQRLEYSNVILPKDS